MEVNPNKIQLSEKDIEDWLFENPKSLSFGYRGWYQMNKWLGRQVKVPSGIIDLLGVVKHDDRYGLVVVEIKNTQHTQSSLLQVSRYAGDITKIAQDLNYKTNEMVFDTVLKVVVGIGQPTNQLQFEADSIEVYLVSFEVNYELSVSGSWNFDEAFRNKNSIEIDNLSNDAMFKNIIESDVPKSIQDFINSIPDESEDKNGMD